MSPQLEDWLCKRHAAIARHVQVPVMCHTTLAAKVLPELEAAYNVVDLDLLLKKARAHTRSLTREAVFRLCEWLHLTGRVLLLNPQQLFTACEHQQLYRSTQVETSRNSGSGGGSGVFIVLNIPW